MDSIIDIIGGCIALEQLGINTLYCSAIPTGHGKINIAHGIYPIPAPATAEILKGIPIAHLMFKVNSQPLLVLHLLRDLFHRLGHFLQQQYNI